MAEAKQTQKKIVENSDFLWAINEAIEAKLQSEKIKSSCATVMKKDLEKLAQDIRSQGNFPKSITTVTNQTDEDIHSSVIKVKESTEQESRRTGTGSLSVAINPKQVEVKGNVEFDSKRTSKEENNNATTTNSNIVQANHTRSVSIGVEFSIVECTISAHADLEICVQLDNDDNEKVIKYVFGGVVIGLGVCTIPLLIAGGFISVPMLAAFSSSCGLLGTKIAAIGTTTAAIGTTTAAIGTTTAAIGTATAAIGAKIAGIGLVYTGLGSGLVTSAAGTIGGVVGYKKVEMITITAEDIFKHLKGYERKGNEVYAVISMQHSSERIDETIKLIPPPNSSPEKAIEQGEIRKRASCSKKCEN